MEKKIKISEIPDGKKIEDYPEDTVFVWDEQEEEDDWFPEEPKESRL